MIELSAVRDVVAIFGVIAGFTYYVSIVRNNQRNQKLALETRKLQIYTTYRQVFTHHDFMRRYVDVMYNQVWEDVDDYFQKYGPSTNPDEYSDFGLDTDGDGLFNYLIINVSVNVTSEGEYDIVGDLYSDRGEIDRVKKLVNLSEGIQIVQLNFSGMKIHRSEKNGPYELESLYISDLYYSDIYDSKGDFSNWDSNLNGIFGEWKKGEIPNDVDIDLYPDIAIGRLPCRNWDILKLLLQVILMKKELHYRECLTNF